MKLHEAIDTA